MFPSSLLQSAADLLAACRTKRLRIATAESCTGGLIAGCLTAISGSSDVVERGFVTYTNESKTAMLGVPAALIAAHGAVSEPVARAMAEGALARSPADLAVAVTGIAGPTGGTPEKPVGLVHLAATRRGGAVLHERRIFAGDRAAVREQTVEAALALIQAVLEKAP